MSEENKRILAVGAHPDDIELMCAGALAHLHLSHGWAITLATMTAGDCGSKTLPSGEIGAIRYGEARDSASILQGEYHCLGEKDFQISYNDPTLRKVTDLIREVKPSLVFTHPPTDYMPDHEVTSQLVRMACFAAPVPNYKTRKDPFEPIPVLYYWDPLGLENHFGDPVYPRIIVDITETLETKAKMLACHDSQRKWLRAQHGIDEYIEQMRRFASKRGELIVKVYAEGFTQHLGHPYPQENILKKVLGDLVHEYSIPPAIESWFIRSSPELDHFINKVLEKAERLREEAKSKN